MDEGDGMTDGDDGGPVGPDPAPQAPGEPVLPPGQKAEDKLRIRHYGPIPKVRDPGAWAMNFGGVLRSGADQQLTVADLAGMPQAGVVGDLHCAGKWSTVDNTWEGVLARDVVERFPPAEGITHVIVYGQYGYSANLRLEDLLAGSSLLATRHNGQPLAPEHGFPVRLVVPHLYSWKGPKWFRGWEYLSHLRRGFWEERGYHLEGDPWQEQRYSYQETHPVRSGPPSPSGPPSQRSGD
jgi:DMSO/TMAO reductase YedYZ molybdopterin-dependent catalytic subunit